MQATPQKEHQWLEQLIGTWAFEGECSMGPDQPPMKSTGTEVVRSLGGLWTIGDIEGEMPGCGECKSIMTLGFDPQAKRFVGTFIASVMTHLWVYSGSLDATGKVLTLDTEGPSCADDTKMVRYQDIITFVSDDHRTLTSRFQGDNGQWQQFMTAQYRRKR